MRFVLLPWQLPDASLIVPPPAADGGVHFEATTESLHSLAVLDREALVFDRHRMVVSHAWPLELVGLLDGETVTRLYVTHALTVGAARAAPEQLLVKLRRVHLFHTPEYRPVLTWLLGGSIEPLVLPSGKCVHAGHGRIKGSDGVDRTWREWLDTQPRLPEELLPLTTTHRERGLLLATAGPGVGFCLDDTPVAPETSPPPAAAAQK